MGMFCNQCEQAKGGTGCDLVGVCGKKPDVAALQDLLLFALKGISIYADKARSFGARDEAIDLFVIEGLFTMVTNVNFDPERIELVIRKAFEMKEKAKQIYVEAATAKMGAAPPPSRIDAANWVPADDLAGLIAQGEQHGINTQNADPDVRSAIETLVYGLKGMAAYADHAYILGAKDDEIFGFTEKALAATTDHSLGLMEFVGLILECGRVNLKTMEILSNAHTGRYGHPVPTPVNLGTKAGKAILVSGHDLLDLEELLKQTEGKGISIYTHGEMIPAHGYPGLKKYKHLAGNYGGAWQDQAKEFAQFPGAILMTTNCIQKPAQSYMDNIFTSGLVAWPGVKHIADRNFAPVIARALSLPGFSEAPGKDILVGFGHNAVLGVADQVIAGVKAGAIKRFFLIGGCDGAKPGRNYFTEFAEAVPKDCVILTLACGKFRFNKLDFGDIGGIPRLLDVGQCNDAYSAIQIALALAGAFDCGVNDLPLSFILSWYEQKAVVILLTLFHLGVKNIKLGPALPAFITPNVLDFLVANFNIAPIGNAQDDLKQIMGQA
ncbi:MAG TPA: hydroxylamine reductase [Candidatus Deferrimicrobiaceae bacterium]